MCSQAGNHAACHFLHINVYVVTVNCLPYAARWCARLWYTHTACPSLCHPRLLPVLGYVLSSALTVICSIVIELCWDPALALFAVHALLNRVAVIAAVLHRHCSCRGIRTPNSLCFPNMSILSHAVQIFDAHKRLLYTGDAVPDEVALSKGEHSARLLLRHDDRALLVKLKGTCLVSRRRRHLLLIGRLHILRCRP
jgi:hypothetical protein